VKSDVDYARAELAAEIEAVPIAFYKPRPTPKRFHLDCDHKTRFAFGGKQSSKTFSIVAEISMAVTGIESVHTPGALSKFKPPPQHWRHWCEDLTRVAKGVLLPIYMKLIPREMLDTRRGQALPGFNVQDGTLYLTTGSTVQFLSYEMAAMKGESVTLDGVAYDEPPPEPLYESQYMRILVRGGHMIGAMTLDERRASCNIRWIDKRIRRRGDGPHVNWFRFPTRENITALIEEAPTDADRQLIVGAYKNAYNSMSQNERDVVFEGRGGWATGLVFPDFDEEVHAAYDLLDQEGVVGLARKGYGTIRAALDGGIDDPTAMIWVYTHGKHPLPSLQLAHGDHLVYREYVVRGLNYPQHAARLGYLSKDEPIDAVFGDPMLWTRDKNGGPPEGRAFFTAFHKLHIPVRPGNRNKRVGHNRLGEWFKVREHPAWPRLRFLKNHCQECVDELYGYSWQPENRRTGKRPDETVDVNDHLVDDLRYWGTSFPEPQPARTGRIQPMARHPVTGVPMPNYVNMSQLVGGLR